MNIEFSQENLELFRRILRNARDTVSSWNGRLVLVYLPNKVRLSSVFARWDAAGYEAEVVETAWDEGIEVINVVPVFQASENPEGLFQGHYTEEGYRLVANSVLSALASRQTPTLRWGASELEPLDLEDRTPFTPPSPNLLAEWLARLWVSRIVITADDDWYRAAR